MLAAVSTRTASDLQLSTRHAWDDWTITKRETDEFFVGSASVRSERSSIQQLQANQSGAGGLFEDEFVFPSQPSDCLQSQLA